MNLKFDIKKFNGEDVIATSGVCANINAQTGSGPDHLYVSLAYDGNNDNATGYEYDPISKKLDSASWESTPLIYNGDIGWYHYDAETGQYKKCTDQSLAAHPTKIH